MELLDVRPPGAPTPSHLITSPHEAEAYADRLWDWNGRVIAIANNKGGVRKTSTVVNVGGILANAGQRVLLVELDTQPESAATDLGYLDRSDHGASLAEALLHGSTPQIIHDVRPRLDVIADGPALEDVVAEAYGSIGRGEGCWRDIVYPLLGKVLEPVAEDYDAILIDCPPGNKVLTDAALGTARWVIIPVASDRASLNAMVGTAASFQRATSLNPTIELLGVLFTAVTSGGTRIRQAAAAKADELFGGEAPTFRTTIRHAEAPAARSRETHQLVHELERIELEEGKSLFEQLRARKKNRAKPKRAWQTNSSGLADDYIQLTNEMVSRIVEREAQEDSDE